MAFLKRIFNNKDRNSLLKKDEGQELYEETSTLTMDQQEEKISTEGEYEVVEREILPAKIICPDCGGITLEGLDFCDKCGGEL